MDKMGFKRGQDLGNFTEFGVPSLGFDAENLPIYERLLLLFTT